MIILRLLDRKIKADEIRAILAAQQAELEREVQAARQRVARVEARL